MTAELLGVIEALCDMWDQYCPPPYGHMFMSAGENAEQVLSHYGLLKNDKGGGGEVDWDKVEQLRKTII